MKLIYVLGLLLLMVTACKRDNTGFTICGTRCTDAAPWTVESLDLGNPCFVSKDSCESWKRTHGYSDKPCVKCN